MNTPTEQAMRAARLVVSDMELPGKPWTGAQIDELVRMTANTIDTATGLPELLAERDTLRKALLEYVQRQEAEGDARGLPEYERGCAALNTKGQS